MLNRDIEIIKKKLKFRVGLNISGSNISIFDNNEDETQGLDIDFDVDKTITGEPNKSKITIWNVSADLYHLLEKGKEIELYGAWGDDNYSLMFVGNLDGESQDKNDIVGSSNKGFLKQDEKARQVDIATTLTLYDAGKTYKETKISKSYKGLVNAKLIIDDCVSLMNLPKGKIDEIEYPNITNYVARGTCISVLNYICSRIGCFYNITNGIFNLAKENKPAETQGIILDENNSNRPEKVVDNQQVCWKIETGLLPYLIPDTYCECNFPTLQGVKRIVRVRLSGNNYGTKCISEVYVV